jgi:hypothetical protein
MTSLGAKSISNRVQATQIDGRLVPDLQRLLDQTTAVQLADPTTVALHRQLIDSIQLTIAGYRAIASGLSSSDAGSLAAGRADLAAATQEFTHWSDTARQL